tara:strand:+ start:920 stop:1981 length:1062 start_codon:yes stop_codon:yes gene_type:complete
MKDLNSIMKYGLYALMGSFLGFLISFFLLEDEFINEGNKLASLNTSYNLAVEKASPAVVNIFSEQIIRNQPSSNLKRSNSIFGERRSVKTSLGSGVILSQEGYILTNQHVIGDRTLKVTIELSNGNKYLAQLIGIDKGTDLAVLKIQDEDFIFPSIEIEDSDKVKIGDIVLAIGNPYGLGQSVSMGIVSATGREFDNPYSNYIQTDASINRGNSGGALIDAKGRLVGINTLIRSSSGGSEGIGLAIPSANALQIVSDLIQYGEVRRGWLGFSIDKLSLRRSGKLVISEIAENGPAFKAGFLKNDVLSDINSDKPSYENLYKTFARSKPNERIPFKVIRDSREVELIIITGEAD